MCGAGGGWRVHGAEPSVNAWSCLTVGTCIIITPKVVGGLLAAYFIAAFRLHGHLVPARRVAVISAVANTGQVASRW